MSTKRTSEIELLRASRAGNAEAFGILIDSYASLVCAITYSATGNTTESEELAQETFLRAWRSLGQLKDLRKFRPWLCRIARSTAQNWFRHRKRDAAGRTAPLEAAAGRPSEETDPAEAAIGREQEAVIRQALAQIPLNLREPLVLFYREQQSARQVAIQLGLSENAARQRISRARAMLRAQVAGMVENTLAETRPGKAFKTAVIAALAGTAVKTATTTAAATGFLSTLAGKIALTAASLALVAGTVWIQQCAKAPHRIAPTANAGISRETDTPSPIVTSPETEDTGADSPEAVTGLHGSQQTSAQPEAQSIEKTEQDNEPIPASAAQTETPSFEFKPQGVLSGLVTDGETGEPVPNALVRITKSRIFDTRTDAHGFYSFDEIHEAGNFTIAIDSQEYVGIPWDSRSPVLALREDKQTVRHFQLPKACMVDLWVVDANGVGIDGAKVVATRPADNEKRVVSYFGDIRQTDSNGYILLGGFTPSEEVYQIAAWHVTESLVVNQDGSRRVHQAYDVAPGHTFVRSDDLNQVPEVQIVLEPGQDVSGYIEYADGVPATDIEVVARPAWWHCNYSTQGYPVNADGTFTIKHITPGLYDICAHITRADFAGGTIKSILQMPLPHPDNEPLVVRLPDKSPLSLASISGTLIFLGEQKPHHVSIDAYSRRTGHHHANVGYENGELKDTFSVDRLEPDTYRLRFSGDQIEEKVIEAVVAPSCDLEVELLYTTKPVIKGIVVDAHTGTPVSSFQARVRKLRTLRGPNYVQPNHWTQFDNKRGYFSVETVGPGIYQIQVAADGYAPVWGSEISTDANDLAEMALVRGGAIAGAVVDDEGTPITGARVIPLSLAGGASSGTTGRFVSEQGAVETVDGAFALKDLPPGAETLKIVHPDYALRIIRDIAVRQGQTTDAVEAVLAPGGTVEGVVYDDRGDPVAGEVLHFQDASGYGGSADEKAGQLASVITDSSGFYRVSHLPEQLCYIKRSDEWRTLGVVRRTLVPINRTVTRADFGDTPTVTGTVLLMGAPLATTRLLMGAVDTPHFGPFKAYTTTDENGTFVFAGAVPGKHAIYREDLDKRNNWLQVATVTVRDVDVNIGTIDSDITQLRVTIHEPDGTSPWQITGLYLGEAGTPFGSTRYRGEAPTEMGQPWVFSCIGSGRYTLQVHRLDGVQWLTEVSLDSGTEDWELSIQLPESSARMFVNVLGTASESLMFWRAEKDILGPIMPDANGHFGIENLPAGRYSIGSSLGFFHDAPSLAEVQLAPHAGQTVTLDLSVTPPERVAHLIVQVVDENGFARDDARLWLDGALGLIAPTYSSGIGYVFMTPPGHQKLGVELVGYHPVEKDITLKATSTEAPKRELLRIVVEPL